LRKSLRNRRNQTLKNLPKLRNLFSYVRPTTRLSSQSHGSDTSAFKKFTAGVAVKVSDENNRTFDAFLKKPLREDDHLLLRKEVNGEEAEQDCGPVIGVSEISAGSVMVETTACSWKLELQTQETSESGLIQWFQKLYQNLVPKK